MSPITHFLVGWTLALAPGDRFGRLGRLGSLDRRGRACVALAGVAPDLDGLGLVVDLATRNTSRPTELWGAYHHIVGHGLAAALAVTAVTFAVSRSARVAVLAFLSFHLHVLGDLVGARGPDGDSWPIFYLWPFNDDVELTWSGQWELNAWPNFVITGACLALAFWWAWRKGTSPLEVFSVKANAAFVEALRKRFGAPSRRS